MFRRQIYFTFLVLVLLVGMFGKLPAIKSKKILTREAIGKKLFFDKILSLDNSVSCASCHKPQFAFSDTVAFSKGVAGVIGKRNAPSVMNVASREALFFDGRANTLESQVIFPIEDAHEMNLPFLQAIKRVQENMMYKQMFMQVYKKLPDSATIVQSIAAYERTLETSNTPSDRWLNDEKNHGMTSSQLRGRELFTGNRARCFDCHFTPDFTSDEFRNIGLFNGKELNDSGRYYYTKDTNDIGKFKIPGLRNIAITAPYMHNGMFKTLREVVDYYDNPSKFIPNSIARDTILPTSIGLSEQEKTDLVNFLHALTDDQFSKK